MNTRIIENILADCWLNAERNVLTEVYKVATEFASDRQWKKYQRTKMEYIESQKPKYFFCDTRKLLFTVSLEMQEWTDKVVIEKLNTTGLFRKAFVVSAKTLTNMSAEMAMGENDRNYSYRFFDNEEAAYNWMHFTNMHEAQSWVENH